MDIIFKGRQTEVQERFRKHATAKLAKIEKLDPKVIRIDVELSTERNPRLAGRKERVELTITTRGPAIRAEAAAEDRAGALDLAYAKLESRLRRASDRRKCRHAGHTTVRLTELPEAPDAAPPAAAGRPAASRGQESPPAGGAQPAGDATADSLVPIEMDGDGPLVVRQKFHAAKPMSIDQALFEMELVGHDFFLFRDVQAGQPSVVYRRRGYQYGVLRLIEEAAEAGPGSPRAAARANGLANGRLRGATGVAGTASPA